LRRAAARGHARAARRLLRGRALRRRRGDRAEPRARARAGRGRRRHARAGMSALETRALDHCLACGARSLARVAMRYEWQGARFPAVRCRRCGMLFLSLQPAGATLASMYAAEYFDRDFRCGRSDAVAVDEAAFRAENDGLL